MKKETIYIANDGIEFRDEYDCFKYEVDLLWLEIKNDVIFFRHNDKLDTDIITMLEECTAFYCKTDTAAEKLDELFEVVINWSPLVDFGRYEKGLYLYSSYRDYWIHYETELNYLKNEAEAYLDEVAEGNI